MHAWPLFPQHEFATREIPLRLREQEGCLNRKGVIAVEILMQAVVVFQRWTADASSPSEVCVPFILHLERVKCHWGRRRCSRCGVFLERLPRRKCGRCVDSMTLARS